MSNNPRELVESHRKATRTARNMPDAANADASLQGYASINALSEEDEIARRAYELFQERERSGERGTPDGDWFRAEQEVRRLKYSESMH